jgi:hypothetical protein
MLVFCGGGHGRGLLKLALLVLGPSVVCMFSPPLSRELGTWIICRTMKFANHLPGKIATAEVKE